jgi:hypothetical protein
MTTTKHEHQDIVPPGPHAGTPGAGSMMTLAEADARIKNIVNQEFNNHIHHLRTELRKEAAEDAKRDRFVKYGGIALGGALVGGGISYLLARRNFRRNMVAPAAPTTTTAHR